MRGVQMRAFKRGVLVVCALAVILAILVFVLENQQPTSLALLGWHTSELPVSLFFIGALLVGMAIGPVLGFIAFERRASRLKRSMLKP